MVVRETKGRKAVAVLAAAGAAAVLAPAAPVTAAASGARAAKAERPPAVAGQFYSGDQARLQKEIAGYLAQAQAPAAGAERPVAIVAPHAGYVYCGRIMADAWRRTAGHDYGLIVLLGTNHTTPGLDRTAVWDGGDWRTPLGLARVDAAAAAALLAADPAGCKVDAGPHWREHSVEVQVPFAQTTHPGVPILPLVVGADEPAAIARLGRALAGLARERRALIVASSDLSHYPAKADAEQVDRAVLAAAASLDGADLRRTIDAQMRRGVPGLVTCACGEAPILAAMAAANQLGGARGEIVSYANSGDVPAGDAGRVVGYGAVVFYAGTTGPAGGGTEPAARGPAAKAPPAPGPPAPAPGKGAPSSPRGVDGGAAGAAGHLSAADRKLLLAHARETIRRRLAGETVLLSPPCGPGLKVKRGAFVTLKEDGDLRGCIGHLAEDTPLIEVVGQMALQAAFQDPRFPPLRREELARCSLEISVLTPMQPVPGPSAIVVGRDGVVLRKQGRSAVFLPQVATEQGWDREQLLSQLARKAGLPPDAWRSGAEFLTFQAEVFGEADAR